MRISKDWWIIGVVAVLAATGCTTIRHRSDPLDLRPLLEVPIDPTIGLSAAFPDYEAVAIGGVRQSNGEARRDGVVDLVMETYDSNPERARTWYTDVIVTRFDTSERAVRELDSSCDSFVRGGPGHPVLWQEGEYCFSSVVRRPTDPRNSYAPEEVYSSWLFVRRDRIVVRLYEFNEDSAKSARNAIIAEVGARLSRLKRAH